MLLQFSTQLFKMAEKTNSEGLMSKSCVCPSRSTTSGSGADAFTCEQEPTPPWVILTVVDVMLESPTILAVGVETLVPIVPIVVAGAHLKLTDPPQRWADIADTEDADESLKVFCQV